MTPRSRSRSRSRSRPRPGSRSWPHDLSLQRVRVVGSTGAGKTTFARALAQLLSLSLIELDALHWGPHWTPKPRATFRALAAAVAAQPAWVADGNDREVRDLLWPRAQTVFWLNYPFHTVMTRALRRTLRRSLVGQTLWHGNRESLLRVLERDGIPRHVWRTWAVRRRHFSELRASGQFPQLTWIEFQAPAQAQCFLQAIDGPEVRRSPAAGDQSTTGRVA